MKVLSIQASICTLPVLMLVLLCFTNCTKELKHSDATTAGRHEEDLAAKAHRKKYNIILFLANDFGYEIPTFSGGKSYTTPTLDMMAGNGIVFSHAYRHPDGFPSRLAFYTGKYNYRNYQKWGTFSYSEKTFGNMLSDAGYATCFVGKWQMNDGDYGLTQRGWQDYRVFLPFQTIEGQRVGRYKNPKIYEDGAYLPESQTKGKYSEDMFSDYLCNFIHTNKQKPFLGVYSFNLVAEPYVPTPDDPAFANWDTNDEINHDNTKYFPGMVAYLDKMVNKIFTKLKTEGVDQNTICMFLSPTATQSYCYSVWGPNNMVLKGQKMQTNMWGTLMPLLVYCPGKLRPHTDPATLIDLTDFMPTIAHLANVPLPTNYGTLDGVSFADNIAEVKGVNRDWVFCHWDNTQSDTIPLKRWVNDTTYKLYDTPGYTKFYNVVKDTFELAPIPENKLTQTEKTRKQQFIEVLQKQKL